MSGLHQRLRRLERPHGVRPCAECGGAPPEGDVRFTLCFDGEHEDALPDRCPSCGRLLSLRLEFDTELDLLT